jgi:hypothetical protein
VAAAPAVVPPDEAFAALPASPPPAEAADTPADEPASPGRPPWPLPVPDPWSRTDVKPLLDAAGQPRVVRREGRLVRTWNPQAPGFYAVEDQRSGRVMNYLHGEKLADRRWREAYGRVVVIEGREFLDARWPGLPVLEVEHVAVIR